MSIITIDGSIGAGKSTVLQYLHNHYKIPIDLEPIDKWQPYLEEIYSPERKPGANFRFQTRVWLDRCWIQEKTLINSMPMLMERSPYFQQNVFVAYNYDSKVLQKREHDLIQEMYARTNSFWTPRGYIYLRSDPHRALERVKKRERLSEDNISLAYMQALHKYHEHAYMRAVIAGLPVICIDVEGKSVPQIAADIWNALALFGFAPRKNDASV